MVNIDFLNTLPPQLRSTIVRVLLACLALLLIWLLRRGLTRVLLLPFRRWVNTTTTQYDDWLLKVLEGPIRLVIFALGITIAAEIISIDTGTSAFVSHLSRTFVILAVIMAFYSATDVIIRSSPRLESITGLKLNEQLLPFMRSALKFIIIALGLVIILQEWNYDVNGLVAGLGLGGLAFSLAAQDTVANLFAFTTIVTDRPLAVGEYIVTPQVEGTVESVGSRNVRIRRLDQAYVTIPNSMITSGPIVNWSRLARRQLNFTLGVTYQASSDQMRELLERIRNMLAAREKVDADTVVVYFTDFGDSALNVLVRCYVWEADWGAFQAEKELINLVIMDIVADVGLSIAFPSRSVYIERVPGDAPPRPVAEAHEDAPEDDHDDSNDDAQGGGDDGMDVDISKAPDA